MASMSYQPPFPPSGQPPRSTPIPSDMFQAPQDMPGNGAPPTPAAFLGNQSSQPQMPYGQMPAMPHIPEMASAAFMAPRRSRSGLLTLFILLMVLVPVGIGAWAVYKAVNTVNKAIDTTDDLVDSHLSDNDRTALGLSGNEQNLFEGAAPAALVTALDNGLPGQPTAFTEIDLYGDYAIATAQNPTLPDHLDRYMWRTGTLGSGDPQTNDADAPSKVFTIADVQWNAIGSLVAQAAALSNVEQGEVSYVLVSRDYFTDGAPIKIRVYVNGPRGSAYIEAAADGTVIAVH